MSRSAAVRADRATRPASAPPATHETLAPRRAVAIALLFGALATFVVATVTPVPAAEPPAASDDRFSEFLAGLLQRRLYDLAEETCRRELASDRSNAERRGLATIELLRVLAEQAGESPAERRKERVQAARQLAAQFVRENPEHPRLILVRAQEALGLSAVGEAVRREVEWSSRGRETTPAATRDPTTESPENANAAGRADYDEAKSLFRDALRSLESLDRDLTTLIPQRFRKPSPPPAPTAEELAVLQNQLRYQLVRTRRQLALCFPADSNDRVGGLATALQIVGKTLAALPADDPLAPRLRLEQAALQRLTGRFDEARATLEDAAWTDAPLALRLAARAERIRLLLEARRPTDALRIAESSEAAAGEEAAHPSAELDFARLELYLALWRDADARRDASEHNGAARWERAAVRTLEEIDVRHGGEWRRRAEALLAGLAASGAAPRGRESLRRAADAFYLQGRLDEALAAYDRAAEQAESDGDDEARFALASKAAAIEQKRKRHAEAARRLETLAAALPSDPRAPAAHHLASWNLAQSIRAANVADSAQQLVRYRQSLERHITRWPNDATTHEARVWLGKLCETQRDWEGAAEAYRGVPADAPGYPDALAGAGRAVLASLDRLKSDPQARRAAAETAAKFFEQAAYGSTSTPPGDWSDAQRAAALVAARAWFATGDAQFGRAERLLRASMEGVADSSDASNERLATARALLLIALAGQDARRAEAETLAADIARLAPPLVLECLRHVAAIRVSADAAARARLARIELALLEPLSQQAARLSESDRATVAMGRAEALRAAGRRDEALAAYRELVKAQPRVGALHEALAELLEASDAPGDLREALDAWRRIAARSEARSPRWFRAKLGVATVQWKLGESVEAARLIRYLQAVPPGLADTPLEPRFLDLLRRCETK